MNPPDQKLEGEQGPSKYFTQAQKVEKNQVRTGQKYSVGFELSFFSQFIKLDKHQLLLSNTHIQEKNYVRSSSIGTTARIA